MQRNTNFHKEGMTAFHMGFSLSNNPHPYVSVAASEWEEGWVDAYLKEQNKDGTKDGMAV